jgi:hypothetical protein
LSRRRRTLLSARHTGALIGPPIVRSIAVDVAHDSPRGEPERAADLDEFGDRVRFTFGGRRILGIIVEDRGSLAGGGRRLYAVRARLDPANESVLGNGHRRGSGSILRL